LPPALQILDVVAGYGKLAIVQKVSVEVDKGEVVTIIGPNGSGKSTLIKSILSFAKVFSGKILYDNVDITGLRADRIVKMGIGYQPQLDNVFINLTVEENLEMGAYVMDDESAIKTNIHEIYDMFPELKARRLERAGNLSGGERQMLAMARALVGKPKILLLDEPTSSLSPKVASQVLLKVSEIRNSGVAVMMAEQNAKKALALSDRGYVLVDGKCVKEGSGGDILADKDIGQLYLGLKA
jgi:branched-chain amino acid transport system ATP-binding protein